MASSFTRVFRYRSYTLPREDLWQFGRGDQSRQRADGLRVFLGVIALGSPTLARRASEGIGHGSAVDVATRITLAGASG